HADPHLRILMDPDNGPFAAWWRWRWRWRWRYPWRTLGGHFHDSHAFWTAAGTGLPGSYQQRETCPHTPEG
ncbi:hypothetical protein AB0L75_38595, partial [Streptomyces sp. NPDC052101]